MNNVVIRVEHLSKEYHLGTISHGTLYHDLQSGWAKFRGKEDPNSRIGSVDTGPSNNTNGRFCALKDISFDVCQGDIVGIIGRNGAGKSTLLKIISRVTAPTKGCIKIQGRVASLLEVGTGFHPELTGRENIFLNGAILGMRKGEIEQKFDEIVRFSEIDKFIDTPVKRYSSGMYVRLAFAVAAHLEPEILLIDEVLAVGDAGFRKKCLGKMENVSHEGRTVLFVSHDLGAISNLCSHTLWLDSGGIKAFGNTRDIVSQYVSSGTLTGGEIRWADDKTAPGNERVRLHAVRVTSEGHVTADVMIDREIRIEVDYWNLQEGAVLSSNMHLRDKMNDYVLASANLPSANLSEDHWVGKARPKGLYRTICAIPGNFLNDENYSIDIGIQNKRLEWEIWEKNLLTFMVHETGEMKKEYMGSWVGVVRPKLDWSTIRLDDENSHETGNRSL